MNVSYPRSRGGRRVQKLQFDLMSKHLAAVMIVTAICCAAVVQVKPSPTPSPRTTQPAQTQQRPPAQFDLADYGVSFQPDERLIIVMAALDAAGFDPTPTGREP